MSRRAEGRHSPRAVRPFTIFLVANEMMKRACWVQWYLPRPGFVPASAGTEKDLCNRTPRDAPDAMLEPRIVAASAHGRDLCWHGTPNIPARITASSHNCLARTRHQSTYAKDCCEDSVLCTRRMSVRSPSHSATIHEAPTAVRL